MRTRYFTNTSRDRSVMGWCIRCEPGKRPVQLQKSGGRERRALGDTIEHYTGRVEAGSSSWRELDGPFGKEIKLGTRGSRYSLLLMER